MRVFVPEIIPDHLAYVQQTIQIYKPLPSLSILILLPARYTLTFRITQYFINLLLGLLLFSSFVFGLMSVT